MIDNNLQLVFNSWDDEQEKKNNPNKISYYYLRNYCTEISLTMGIDRIASTLKFKIPYAIYSPSIIPINIKKGDKIMLTYMQKVLFDGKVIDVYISSNQEMEVVCYDYCWYLCKSKISKNFSNISVIDAIKWVYNNVGLYFNENLFKKELGDNANIILDTHLVENREANKVISAIYSDVRNKTGLTYYMHTSDTYDVIVSEADRYYSKLSLEYSSKNKADGNIIDYSIEDSMESMINQIRVYKEDATPVNMHPGSGNGEAGEEDNIVWLNQSDCAHYGTIQEIITMSSDDDIEKVRQKANNIMIKNNGEPILNVTCFGDLDYKVGYGVHVKIPNTEFYDKFAYINTSQFIWNQDGSLINKLECKLSKHVDTTDWDEVETKDTANDSTKSSETNGIVESAVSWAIAIANDNSHGYSQEQSRRWGTPDYDCSSLVISAFEQAGIPLKTNGATYTGNMKAVAMKCGFEIVNWNHDMNNLKRGDILLNTANHTEIYVGNGKNVGAHSNYDGKAGDSGGNEISINNYHDYPWDYVLRYPESKNTSNTDNSLDNAGKAKSREEFVKIVSSFTKELAKKYHIFAGVQIACAIQESWTSTGFTELAKNYNNFGGVKTADKNKSATGYKPPKNEGNMLYRKFDSVKDYFIYWCELISGNTGITIYKKEIADKKTAKEQIMGFTNTPYAVKGNSAKSNQMWQIYNELDLSKLDGTVTNNKTSSTHKSSSGQKHGGSEGGF